MDNRTDHLSFHYFPNMEKTAPIIPNDTHRNHYVGYPWCPNGIHLYMRNDSFRVAFCGSFPLCEIGPRMDMESALYWHSVGCKGGLVYW